MKIVDWVAKLAGAKSAVASLHDADVALRGAHDAGLAERSRLVSLRPPLAELLEALDAEINKLGREWISARGLRLVDCLSRRLTVTPRGQVEGVGPPAGLASEIGMLDLATLCALCPEALRAGLAAVVTSTSYEAGPPMKDRVALLAEVDARIASLEAEHLGLVDEAAAAGIQIEHLPINRSRQVQAEQARERAERAERDSRPRHA